MSIRTPITAFIIVAVFAFAAMKTSADAQEATPPEAVLERLFDAPEIEAGWFAPSFLAQVPAEQVAQIVDQLESQHGALRGVTGEGQRYIVTLERAEVPTRLLLDREGRIAGLLFEPPVALGGLSEQVEAIARLPGKTAVLVVSGGEVQAEHNADEPLAVGSAAKLAILKAVREAVEKGSLAWNQVVTLDDTWRSLPTGILQDWPEETSVTIATLANLMISISDNTATDALIEIVGREAVESVSPRNAPFLSTRELFVLKAAENEQLRRSWVEGDETARRDILARIASAALPDVMDLTQEPTVEVEWFLSARELCMLMEDLADIPALHINPGVADPNHWRSIAFKGGSETGILNFTTRLEGADGASHCVVATWNNADAAVENQQLASTYGAMLRVLRAE